MKSLTEEKLRNSFAEKLRNYGWDVLEEVWLTRLGTHYRADIVARHFDYDKLEWFLFELKKPIGDFGEFATKTHKQIVYRYIGSRINDFRYPSINDIPKVYVYQLPYSKEKGWFGESWGTLVRFFNRYGIGLLFLDETQIIFNPNNPHWSRLHLNPEENSDWFELTRLKNYLEARTFGLK